VKRFWSIKEKVEIVFVTSKDKLCNKLTGKAMPQNGFECDCAKLFGKIMHTK